VTLGSVETAVGRYDDALRHLGELRDLAERLDNARLTAAFRVQLGTLAVLRDQPEEARTLLEQALRLSVAVGSTRDVTLCLAAFAQLAFQEGDPQRAALLAGAAEDLRRRPGCAPGRPCGRARTSRSPRSSGAGGRPVRPVVRRRRPAQPAAGSRRRPRSTRRKHDRPLSTETRTLLRRELTASRWPLLPDAMEWKVWLTGMTARLPGEMLQWQGLEASAASRRASATALVTDAGTAGAGGREPARRREEGSREHRAQPPDADLCPPNPGP
jgi:Tetratricopeptide repeat